jgi:hypothetical protein
MRMDLPELNTEALAGLRLRECQGTLIGGLKVALGLGITAEEFGYRMMMEQGMHWAKLAGDLDKIARIFHEHYQVTYGFGEELVISLTDRTLRFEMPSLRRAAALQLQHWRVPPNAIEDVNRGFWRALQENAGVSVSFTIDDARTTVTVRSNASRQGKAG